MTKTDVKAIAQLVQQLRRNADQLKEKSGGVQAVERNLDRILASIKMLELNISDVQDLL